VRVLAFRHVPFEGLGLIEPTLESRGIAFHYADLNQHGAPLPDTSRYDGLIFLGGPMSANDALPYLRTEPGAIEPAVATGKPVLGVCLGAQLIARALGARVLLQCGAGDRLVRDSTRPGRRVRSGVHRAGTV